MEFLPFRNKSANNLTSMGGYCSIIIRQQGAELKLLTERNAFRWKTRKLARCKSQCIPAAAVAIADLFFSTFIFYCCYCCCCHKAVLVISAFQNCENNRKLQRTKIFVLTEHKTVFFIVVFFLYFLFLFLFNFIFMTWKRFITLFSKKYKDFFNSIQFDRKSKKYNKEKKKFEV